MSTVLHQPIVLDWAAGDCIGRVMQEIDASHQVTIMCGNWSVTVGKLLQGDNHIHLADYIGYVRRLSVDPPLAWERDRFIVKRDEIPAKVTESCTKILLGLGPPKRFASDPND